MNPQDGTAIPGLHPSVIDPIPPADGLVGLVVYTVFAGVMLAPLLDYIKHKIAGGRTLAYWQPTFRHYVRAMRFHHGRLPVDALLVVGVGYIALLSIGAQALRLHVLFWLLALASLMPPLYIVSERGVLIMRPRLPWRREISPWQFSWKDVEDVQPTGDGIILHLRAAWPGLPPHRRLLPTEESADWLSAALRHRRALLDADPADTR